MIHDLPETRRCRYGPGRAVFLTVLRRITTSESERSALERREGRLIDNAGELQLQHLYCAMAWLGEELDDDPPEVRSPRRIKDRIAEKAFARCRDQRAGSRLSSTPPRSSSPVRPSRSSECRRCTTVTLTPPSTEHRARFRVAAGDNPCGLPRRPT